MINRRITWHRILTHSSIIYPILLRFYILCVCVLYSTVPARGHQLAAHYSSCMLRCSGFSSPHSVHKKLQDNFKRHIHSHAVKRLTRTRRFRIGECCISRCMHCLVLGCMSCGGHTRYGIVCWIAIGPVHYIAYLTCIKLLRHKVTTTYFAFRAARVERGLACLQIINMTWYGTGLRDEGIYQCLQRDSNR